MSDTYLSKKAYDELNEKLKYMKSVKRREISRAIGEAREHGDLKENSAYHEAKKEQGLNEMRIAELEEKLRNAQIIKDKNIPKGKVVMGSIVSLKDLTSKGKLEYTIVSELEADIFQNKISTSSPLGSTLLNRKVNDVVEFEAPKGIMRYKILKIF
ncbi:MAG: transcription elongation factor GreA [Candidatus Margulisiibacteriota bacterium]